MAADCSKALQSAAKTRPPLCRLESCMLMSRVALRLAPAVQAATTRLRVAAPFQVISCTWVARHSDAKRGGLRRESHAKHGPMPTKNQCTKHPSAQSACTQRQREANTTNMPLLSRHTRNQAARGDATVRGGRARVHFPRLPLISRKGSRAARPWLWCLAPCRLTTETPRPYEDLTRPYVHPDHTRVCASP